MPCAIHKILQFHKSLGLDIFIHQDAGLVQNNKKGFSDESCLGCNCWNVDHESLRPICSCGSWKQTNCAWQGASHRVPSSSCGQGPAGLASLSSPPPLCGG